MIDAPKVNDIRRFCVSRPLISNTWAEFGVAGGASAREFLEYLPEDGTFYLFDHFKGLPEPWLFSNRYGKDDQWAAKGKPHFDDERVVIKEGLFADTLPLDDLLGFVHIDCDLYSSTKTALAGINVRPGTIILFDEFMGFHSWQDHEYKALSEWGRDYRYIAHDGKHRAAIELL